MNTCNEGAISQTECKLCPLAVHQLFSFFDLGLVVSKLSRDDLHSTRNLFLQARLTLSFGAALATARPFNAGEVLRLVRYTAELTRLRTSGLRFGCSGLGWEILCQDGGGLELVQKNVPANTKRKRSGYISRSVSAFPLFNGPATEIHPVPTRNVTAERVNTGPELNSGLVELTRPLCTLSGLTGVWLMRR